MFTHDFRRRALTVSGPSDAQEVLAAAVLELQDGTALKFADWPDVGLPRRAAGVYTIWRQENLLYAGMSGRGAKAELFTLSSEGKRAGLWTRLNSHASGRRSGDQFNVYICDRFVVPALTRDQQQAIASGQLLLDRMTRDFIRQNLTYRYLVCRDGTEALKIERSIRAGQLPAGRPYLNPLLRLPRSAAIASSSRPDGTPARLFQARSLSAAVRQRWVRRSSCRRTRRTGCRRGAWK